MRMNSSTGPVFPCPTCRMGVGLGAACTCALRQALRYRLYPPAASVVSAVPCPSGPPFLRNPFSQPHRPLPANRPHALVFGWTPSPHWLPLLQFLQLALCRSCSFEPIAFSHAPPHIVTNNRNRRRNRACRGHSPASNWASPARRAFFRRSHHLALHITL